MPRSGGRAGGSSRSSGGLWKWSRTKSAPTAKAAATTPHDKDTGAAPATPEVTQPTGSGLLRYFPDAYGWRARGSVVTPYSRTSEASSNANDSKQTANTPPPTPVPIPVNKTTGVTQPLPTSTPDRCVAEYKAFVECLEKHASTECQERLEAFNMCKQKSVVRVTS